MNADFPRILTLLRKEKGISQKQVAVDLGISQALLSHYEKGIRECGLDFLIRCANYYQVSCDYLLGRSPDRTGSQITVDDIPDPEMIGKENTFKGSVLPTLNKKLIANSMNILFDLLSKGENKGLTTEVSAFLMLSVYRMFRVVYGCNDKNQENLFTVPQPVASRYADAAMQLCEANAASIAEGHPVVDAGERALNAQALHLTTELLGERYPLFASSLLNLIQHSENRISFQPTSKKR